MQYRRLGASGLKVSEICLGAWINFGERIDDPQTFAVLDTALEEGIDFFDTADVYAGGKAEEVMGRWMQGKDRRTLTIATKGRGRMWDGVNGEGLSRKHLTDACHGCKPTTLICTNSTGLMPKRPLKKRCAPSMTS